jgi:hypothetical protein
VALKAWLVYVLQEHLHQAGAMPQACRCVTVAGVGLAVMLTAVVGCCLYSGHAGHVYDIRQRYLAQVWLPSGLCAAQSPSVLL